MELDKLKKIIADVLNVDENEIREKTKQTLYNFMAHLILFI